MASNFALDRTLLATPPSRSGLSSALTGPGKANAKQASRVLRATVRSNLALNPDASPAALRAVRSLPVSLVR